jgi:hypothetical protein
MRNCLHKLAVVLRLTFVFIVLVWLATAGAEDTRQRPSMILVVGAGGEEKFSGTFAKWAGNLQSGAAAGGVKLSAVGLDDPAGGDRQRLKSLLESEPREGTEELWVVLLGHGTSDGKEPKFNLRGDDLAASELADWLKPFQRTTVVVCGFSSSGPWLKLLAASERIVITATRSGAEHNYARLGGYLAQSVADPAADVDKDGETSLLEAWLVAARKTADFYKDEGRLATEHSLLDDNGDGLGTPPDWFQGVRAVKKARDSSVPDGIRAHQIRLVRSSEERALSPGQRSERDKLERELSALRERKSGMKEEDYLRELEELLLKLARVYREGS